MEGAVRRMGSRAHGTWARLYADVWDHPKTLALARSLEAIGCPSRWSSDAAVGQLHRLACRLADTTADGRIGHLTPQAFCRLIGWTDHRNADAVLAAWLSSGFIDEPGTDVATLHGFEEMFGLLLKKRDAKRKERERMRKPQSSPKRGDRGSDSPRDRGSDSPSLESESKTLSTENTPLPLSGSGSDGEPEGVRFLADLWAETNPSRPQPRRPLLKGGVLKALATAWKREHDRDQWRERFSVIGASDLCQGRTEWAGADILWAVGPKNTAKIDGGAFRNGGRPRAAAQVGYGIANQNAAALERFKQQAAQIPEAEQEATPW